MNGWGYELDVYGKTYKTQNTWLDSYKNLHHYLLAIFIFEHHDYDESCHVNAPWQQTNPKNTSNA